MIQSFKELNLIAPILNALDKEGHTIPTPVQQEAIPHILAGRDVLACAQTGTGKTAAFALPILQQLHLKPSEKQKKIKALILAPTRELAIQIGNSFNAYGKNTQCKHAVIYGGVSQREQTITLGKGIDILIATPGRLKDLYNQGFINLNTIEFLVLDEADRMLDMGFIHDIKFILSKISKEKQSVFFTATLTTEIKKLADTLLTKPATIEVTPENSTSDTITQLVYCIEKEKKRELLLELLTNDSIPNALIFSKTKHGADRLAKELNKQGIKSDAMHGDKSQNFRQNVLANFKSKKTRILVVTDVASRGIDIAKLPYVINYDMPDNPETYVHRIGRTGRAGVAGNAISFCSMDEIPLLKQINKIISKDIPVSDEYPLPAKNTISKEATYSSNNRSNKGVNTWIRNRRVKNHRNAPKRNHP